MLALLVSFGVLWMEIEVISTRPTAFRQWGASNSSSQSAIQGHVLRDPGNVRQFDDSHDLVSDYAPEISDSTESQECLVILNVKVNCSARDYKGVPKTNFPKGIVTYDLSRNQITVLPSHAFSRYTLLIELNLERNSISKIDSLAFVGLSNLDFLNLNKNKLVMNNETLKNAFSDTVFSPLSKLRWLRLEGNNPQPYSRKLRYPDRALSQLTALERLQLDGLTFAEFGSGFANLTKLSNLSLAGGYTDGRCDLTALKNGTFQYLTTLETLNLNDCNLQGNLIEAGTFLPLTRLKELFLNHNQKINVQFFDRLFYGLQHTTTLKSLYMESVVSQYSVGICLSSQYIKYFPQSVEYLNIKTNRLECIDRQVIDKISTSLKVLDISRNDFVFGTYLMDLPKLDKLKYVILDDKITTACQLPRSYPYNPHTPPLDIGNCSLYARNEQENLSDDFILHLPPNLREIKMRFTKFLYALSYFNIHPNNSLELLKLEGNYFPYLKGPVIGLEKLRNCRLSRNYIQDIKSNFFHTFPLLQTLNLSSNLLGTFFAENPKTKIFQSLVKLQVLDLALNTIRVLGPKIFDGMSELRYLRISHNPIFHFDPDLSHKYKLTTFIAIDTSISVLKKEVRDVFTAQVRRGLRVRVELDQSPIVCDCPNMAFLTWMVTSGAFRFKHRDYFCYYPDTSSIKIHDGYAETMQILSRECTAHQSLLFILVAGTVCFVMFIVCSLSYRYRWKLRYLYHAAYIYMSLGSRPVNHFDYDVFICYAEEDRHFVMDMLYPALEARGLSVCVHHRHFRAGELIGSNIVRAVNTCRRTVVVLTRTLAESSWCNYEIQMANMETAQRGSPVLIFLLLGGMRSSEMKKELLYNVQNNTYIQFPPASCTNERALNALYDKLARDIRN